MIATNVDICNLALDEIGAQAVIATLADPTTEAALANRHYDHQRRALLRYAHWGFARQQISLAQVGDFYPDGTSPFPFQYEYTYPADCIKLRYILNPPPTSLVNGVPSTGSTLFDTPWLMPNRNNTFLVHNDSVNGKVILTNVYQALGVYTQDITNVLLFDELFIEALVKMLAAKFVIPLTGNAQMKNAFEQQAMMAITQARVADGNESLSKTDHVPDWIRERGMTATYGDNVAWGPNTGIGSWFGGWDNVAWGE